LKFKTQLNGAEDPCKAQKDDLNGNRTTLEGNIAGVNNVGLTHGTPDEVETMLKAKKRLFLLSTVQPNAEAQYYGEFMDLLIAQRDLWNHTHEVEEAETNRSKADALAVAGLETFITYINETIVEAEKTHAAGNPTEDFVIDHTNGYQGAYKVYLNEAEKSTAAILDALVEAE